ncbi:MAG: hypothetical protein K2L54_05830 [Clostridiales bacterium]|nr:hypothetical protein [Clostridiales bacterium]
MSDNGRSGKNRGADEYRDRAEAELDKRLEKFQAELCGMPPHGTRDNNGSRENTGNAAESVGGDPVAEINGSYAFRAVRAALEAAKNGAQGDAENFAGVHGGHRLRLRDSVRNDVRLDGFSDVELVETLLSYLVPQKDTNVTAHALLERYGSVLGVLRAPTEELVKFSMVTAPAAQVLPMLALACLWNGERGLKIPSPQFAADFFGTMTVGLRDGTYAAYLDAKFRLIAFERCGEKDELPSREIICSADRCNAKYVLPMRREPNIYPDAFGLTKSVERLSVALSAMNKRLLDFMLFTEFGYYTLGKPPTDKGWYAQYVFVPYAYYPSNTEFFDDGRDMAAELAAVATDGELEKP